MLLQVDKICKLLGAPTDDEWPGMLDLPDAKLLGRGKLGSKNRLRNSFEIGAASWKAAASKPALAESGLALMAAMLVRGLRTQTYLYLHNTMAAQSWILISLHLLRRFLIVLGSQPRRANERGGCADAPMVQGVTATAGESSVSVRLCHCDARTSMCRPAATAVT